MFNFSISINSPKNVKIEDLVDFLQCDNLTQIFKIWNFWMKEFFLDNAKNFFVFQSCFFAFSLWFMSYFLPFFASYKVSLMTTTVTMLLIISWTKNLYFLAGVFWLFFAIFKAKKCLRRVAERRRASSRNFFITSRRWKGQSSSFQK